MTDNAQAPQLATADRAALVSSRIEAIRELLQERNAAAITMDARRDFAWLTLGGQNHILYTSEIGVAPIVVTANDAVILAPVNEFDRIADEEVAGLPLRVVSLPWWKPDATSDWISKAIGHNGGVRLTSSQIAEEMVALRSPLTDVEHQRMAWLADVVNTTLDPVMAQVRRGMSEDDLVAETTARFAKRAVRVPVVLVASDDRIERYRHPLPFTRSIERRVMLVVVAERWGLHVALTQFAELEEMPAELERRAAALADVLAEMRRATRVGNTLGDVFAAAQEAYAGLGLNDEWQLHHQGGTIGYQARERVATPADPTTITPGMAFAWNPSAPGFKREETLYLDASGAQRVLTSTR